MFGNIYIGNKGDYTAEKSILHGEKAEERLGDCKICSHTI